MVHSVSFYLDWRDSSVAKCWPWVQFPAPRNKKDFIISIYKLGLIKKQSKIKVTTWYKVFYNNSVMNLRTPDLHSTNLQKTLLPRNGAVPFNSGCSPSLTTPTVEWRLLSILQLCSDELCSAYRHSAQKITTTENQWNCGLIDHPNS